MYLTMNGSNLLQKRVSYDQDGIDRLSAFSSLHSKMINFNWNGFSHIWLTIKPWLIFSNIIIRRCILTTHNPYLIVIILNLL